MFALAEYPQGYCGEIRQMPTFHINLYWLKTCLTGLIIKYVSLNIIGKNYS
jgi:hypothetical protein